MWRRSTDIFIGHEPNFEIACRLCGVDMVLRYSAAVLDRIIMRSGNRACTEMAYKCPECGRVDRFIVTDSPEYIKKMLVARRGITLYYPPVSSWAKASDLVRRQLAALGYMGGLEVDDVEAPKAPSTRPS